jgi:CRISPR/Cas system-associated protein Csx1
MFKNAEDMNKEKIKFSFSESIEKIINFIVDNFHQIVLLFILKQNFPIILNMDSVIAKFIFIALVVIGVLKLLYSILEKKGIGIEEKQVLESNIEIVSKELERSITESNAKPPTIISQDDFMLKNLYRMYK